MRVVLIKDQMPQKVLRATIKTKVNSSHFESITEVIYKSKRKTIQKGKTTSGKKV